VRPRESNARDVVSSDRQYWIGIGVVANWSFSQYNASAKLQKSLTGPGSRSQGSRGLMQEERKRGARHHLCTDHPRLFGPARQASPWHASFCWSSSLSISTRAWSVGRRLACSDLEPALAPFLLFGPAHLRGPKAEMGVADSMVQARERGREKFFGESWLRTKSTWSTAAACALVIP
jgi:hypothetical protein